MSNLSLKGSIIKMEKRKHPWFVTEAITATVVILLVVVFVAGQYSMQLSGSPDCGTFASESGGGAETGIFQPSASDFFFEHAKEKEIMPLEWLSAAENGNAWAQCRVGDYYASGSGGFKYDPCEALKWWDLAYEQGNTAAKFRIAKYFFLKSFICWCEEHPFL